MALTRKYKKLNSQREAVVHSLRFGPLTAQQLMARTGIKSHTFLHKLVKEKVLISFPNTTDYPGKNLYKVYKEGAEN